ncbi:nuclear transport factor 2 family protein [Frankia sp. CNm7]|uniref:Nuclear transport factor 2 family protein n=1 Tax=Frankia nepalensis TaxID=1836974 RepID=A0A937UQB4_9ACTN|nr:nuclear transport factor 2 family protein [Frankia nepalensis]MBL7495577.1 nuclear transport factor 2 family protein [Frankia nepalensis]MBL7508823.1 nuclear transport factor 2 family protein [Frankia nepalensis]MBL7519357.1 nuclear transport factor 2 family protein [Frankia nepalensis]MBL7630047.1 nuclear transport factor 2 family protein [Frankia nepalensis]
MTTSRAEAAADRLEIHEVLTRYTHAVDARDWPRLSEVFTEGSVVDFTRNGGVRAAYPEIVDYLRESLSIFVACQHYLSNVDIQLDGDTASGRAYVLTQMITLDGRGGETLLADGGYYDCRFARTATGWRLTEYVAGLVWLDGAWPQGVPRPGWWGAPGNRFAPAAVEVSAAEVSAAEGS